MAKITPKQRKEFKDTWMKIFETLLDINRAIMDDNLKALDAHYAELDYQWPMLTMYLDDILQKEE